MFNLILSTSQVDKKLLSTLRWVSESSLLPNQLILVLDGCSPTPDLNSLLAKFTFEIVLLQNENRLGLVHSLKKAEAYTTCAYAARVDAGDWVDRDRFKKQYDFLEKNPEYIIVGTRTKLHLIYRDRVLKKLTPAMGDLEIKRLLPQRNPFVHGSIMLRTEALRTIGGYDTDFTASQDYDLYLRLIPYGRMHILSDVLTSHSFDYSRSTTFKRGRTQLVKTVKTKTNYLLRTKRIPGFYFMVFYLRDIILASLPAFLIAYLKRRGFKNGAVV